MQCFLDNEFNLPIITNILLAAQNCFLYAMQYIIEFTHIHHCSDPLDTYNCTTVERHPLAHLLKKCLLIVSGRWSTTAERKTVEKKYNLVQYAVITALLLYCIIKSEIKS